MGMIAGGAYALPNETDTHYGSHSSSSSEWSITDRDGWELDMGNIKEILWAQIHYQSEVKNQHISEYKAFIKMPYDRGYQVHITDQQKATIQQDIYQFKEKLSNLSEPAQNDNLEFEGFAKFASIFTTPIRQQHIDKQTINIVGSASFVWDPTKNKTLAADRAQYVHNLLNTKHQENSTLSIDIPEINTLTVAEQSQLEAYAVQAKTTPKNLIREHNLGKKFSWEADEFLTQHLEEKQGASIHSETHCSHTMTQDFSLSAYWLVLAWLGITFRKKLKNASQSLAQNIDRLKIWGQKFFTRKWSASDARERLREDIRWEVDDPGIGTDDLKKSNTQEITPYREAPKTWRQKFTDFFQRKKQPPEEIQDDTPLSSEVITEHPKELLATEASDQRDMSIPEIDQEIEPVWETEKILAQPQSSESPQAQKTQPIKQDRWRPNARRAIGIFDAIIEESILKSEGIPKELIERKDLLRDLMKKESWDILEREIRSIVRILWTQHIHYTKQDRNNLLNKLDQLADDIAGRELFGRWYLSHTMSPYFVQKDINNMRSDPIAERIKNISKFAPTAKFDIGNGDYIYLSNRVRAADGAKNDHIALYALHEGKLTGYVFEESRTTWEWKLLPSKQWKHSDTLEQITTQHAIHATKSLGSLTIHTLNPAIITEIFKQPLVSSMPRNEIMHILHTPGPNMESIAEAA